jgi:NADH:ubiquinone oxidoreductase subunit
MGQDGRLEVVPVWLHEWKDSGEQRKDYILKRGWKEDAYNNENNKAKTHMVLLCTKLFCLIIMIVELVLFFIYIFNGKREGTVICPCFHGKVTKHRLYCKMGMM